MNKVDRNYAVKNVQNFRPNAQQCYLMKLRQRTLPDELCHIEINYCYLKLYYYFIKFYYYNGRRHSTASRKAEVEMGGAHSSKVKRNAQRSVGRPPTRRTDHIKRVAGSRWKQAAQNRGFWNSLQKTYVQQWA
ncbi:jg11417 [Pararge aegeria aegeria]|uniref:Jg11417 protein n=1 Tax=Pararge aegeria aegeria TaxID=348720 RepID=A0A8S4QM10_9NEOP|nr:jg11417 [Pararge aegeria aegeria]